MYFLLSSWNRPFWSFAIFIFIHGDWNWEILVSIRWSDQVHFQKNLQFFVFFEMHFSTIQKSVNKRNNNVIYNRISPSNEQIVIYIRVR